MRRRCPASQWKWFAGHFYAVINLHIMADHDQVKGQAYITSAIAIGGVFSNLVSGFILDNLGMKPMLVTGSAVCMAGVLTAFAALKKPAVIDTV